MIDFSRPFFPPIFQHLNIVQSSWNLAHMFLGWFPLGLFFIFSKFPPFPPLGGNYPPFPPQSLQSRNIFRLPSNLVWVFSTIILTKWFGQFSEIPPFSPQGGRGNSPQKSTLSKYCQIALKFGLHVLSYNSKRSFMLLSEISPIPPPGGGGTYEKK